ncbi:MAG: carbohydrate kinase family protein [Acidobacteria bacterium]|nr:carbohydrate kinase family protein [Acidobacteriota bacterium]
MAFGENSLDFVGTGSRPPAGVDKTTLTRFELLVGGQATTAAVACARQGLRARYVGVFGRDEWGATVRRALDREGVDLVALERDARSRVAVVLVDSDTGDRTVHEFRDPALAVDRGAMPVEAVLAGRILMLDATDLATSTAIARLARERGVPTVVDVDRVSLAAAELLREIAVIVVPRAFLESWTSTASPGAGLAALDREFQPAATIVTLGAEGSLALANGREIRTPGFQVDVVDTTGAGDAFRAGFVSAWIRLADAPDLETILEQANATAALNCQAVGAQTGLPRRPDVDRLVAHARGREPK